MKKQFKIVVSSAYNEALAPSPRKEKGVPGKGHKNGNYQIPESIFDREYAEYKTSKEKEN